MKIKLVFGAMALAMAVTTTATAEVDPELREYRSVSGISGTISSVGSDTLAKPDDLLD